MIYGSVCSGIEAASVAWHPLGWRASFLSEIEAFPRAVLSHHYPEVPLHGDFTTIAAGQYDPIDLLVGGTPCQSFSVAGLRGGLDDDRGNLALEYLRMADRLRPRWLVWENVPGVLSSNRGRDFGAILGGMVELGYGFAYRVLDAQFFGVAQRRRRVFVVGYAGDWRRAAAVLFERHSLSGHPAPRREPGERAAQSFGLGSHAGSAGEATNSSHASGGPVGFGLVEEGTPALRAGRTQAVAHALRDRDYVAQALMENQRAEIRLSDATDAMSTGGGKPGQGYPATFTGSAVRRLTPRECERLQGFPDDWTKIPYRGKPPEQCADGPRYKALGNSMAVPCMVWLGQRIQQVETLYGQGSEVRKTSAMDGDGGRRAA